VKNRLTKLAALLAVMTLLFAACGGDDAAEESTGEAAQDDDETTTTEGEDDGASGGEACPGTQGCTPEFPEDEDIKIGMLSAGDTNDNGYYESFVVAAREYAEENDWEAIIVDRVQPADVAEQARNLCRQGVHFIGLADSELVDAFPVAEEDVCEGVVFYINSDDELTPFVFNTTDDIYESQLAAGYATGLIMEQLGKDRAAFIGGPDLDFVTQAFDSWTAGIKLVLPDATTSKTLTGDFDDSALGQEAAKAQIAEGAGILYPYLGGATDAVAKAGLDAGVFSVAPGTDRCEDPAYAAASLFPPGEFFLIAIQAWENGEVKMGESFANKVGVQPFPSVKVCDNGNVDDAAGLQGQADDFMEQIGSGEIDAEAEVTGG
jgi:basic membrane protein A and related proteins